MKKNPVFELRSSEQILFNSEWDDSNYRSIRYGTTQIIYQRYFNIDYNFSIWQQSQLTLYSSFERRTGSATAWTHI